MDCSSLVWYVNELEFRVCTALWSCTQNAGLGASLWCQFHSIWPINLVCLCTGRLGRLDHCLDCLSATDVIIGRVYFLQRVAARLWKLSLKVLLFKNLSFWFGSSLGYNRFGEGFLSRCCLFMFYYCCCSRWLIKFHHCCCILLDHW